MLKKADYAISNASRVGQALMLLYCFVFVSVTSPAGWEDTSSFFCIRGMCSIILLVYLSLSFFSVIALPTPLTALSQCIISVVVL